MSTKTAIFTLLGSLAAVTAGAQSVLVDVEGLEPGETAVRGFLLDSPQKVKIQSHGLRMEGKGDRKVDFGAAWILDADSRRVVWKMAADNLTDNRRGLRQHGGELELAAGAYEVYYATLRFGKRYDKHESWWQSVSHALARRFGWGEDVTYDQAIAELGITVRGNGRALSAGELAEGRAPDPGTLIRLTANEDHFSAKSGFVIERPVEVEIYAVGELTQERGWDHGWILDAESREKVWKFTYAESEPAGGADKNRTVRQRLRLPAGEYAAVFVTDGSHSPPEWNTMPPYDPQSWGMTVRVREPGAMRFVKTVDYHEIPDEGHIVAELTRLRDDESRSRGFELSAPATLRVYALGEGFKGGGMVDHGWIVDARTREKVWSMQWEQTEHGGGAIKNRVADELIRLDAGQYMLVAVTDDSHTYREWNAAPPRHPERWGITLYAHDEDFDRSSVKIYRADEDPTVLARINQVRNHSDRRQNFVLDRPTEVWIYAVGEGIDGEMYDYGWLEDGDGRVVWKMSFENTAGAGGDAKNRLFRGTVDLAAGRYSLRYRTDDSHAYRQWNSPPPTDPEAWGIQVALAD